MLLNTVWNSIADYQYIKNTNISSYQYIRTMTISGISTYLGYHYIEVIDISNINIPGLWKVSIHPDYNSIKVLNISRLPINQGYQYIETINIFRTMNTFCYCIYMVYTYSTPRGIARITIMAMHMNIQK